jgi:hypothetical protein
MTPEIATQLANHNARITACEHEQQDLRQDNKTVADRLDKLLFLMLGTLVSAVAALVVGILKH